jgi:hypothetical protein
MMMAGFPFLAGRVDRAIIDAYLAAVANNSVEAVALACRRFAEGDVPGWDAGRAPTAPQVAQQARIFDQARAYQANREARDRLVAYKMGELPPPGATPIGPLEVDFGNGRIDMRDMTPTDKETVLRTGKPLPREGERPVARLQRMGR